MDNNEFLLELIASLDQAKSKKQINSDIRQIEKAISMLRVTGTLAKGDTKKEINKLIKDLSSKLNQIKLKGKFDDKNLKREINKSLHNLSFGDIDMLNIDENKTKLKMKKAIADVKAFAEKNTISVNVEMKKDKLNNDLTSFLNRNSKIKESSILLKESERIRELINSVDDKNTLKNATESFQLYKSEVQATGFSCKSTTDKIKDMLSRVTKISGVFGVASLAVNNFRQSLSTLKDNDTIITEISKTSELTKNQLEELGNEAFKVASKYGQLSSSFLLGVQEMSRAGYENADSMAALSTKVQGAGDMTAELANQYIIATDKAYKMNGSINALTLALDGANNITNNNAVNMTELAEGMSIVGSQAASSGMKVNETTAALATMIAVTQQGGSQMANAFKGILMNLQQVTGEVEDGGDAIDTESLNKYEKACNDLGVSLSTVKDGIVSLREPMQIIKELSEAYVKLDRSDAKRANLLSSVGGKYRANALNAILENHDMYSQMLDDYANGLGSMDKEAEKTANSWEGRLNQLQNSWDSFVNSLTNKEAIKGSISFFDKMIQSSESLINTIGEIPVIVTALNTGMVAMNKDYGISQIWNKDEGKVDVQGNLFGIDFTAIKEQKKHFGDAEKAIAGWNGKLLQGQTDINKFNESIVQNNAQLKAYLSTCSKDAPASLSGYKSYLNAAGVSTDALRVKTLLLNAAISFGIGVAMQAITKAISGLYEFSQISDTVANNAKELGNSFKSTSSDIESYKEKISDLHDTINDSTSSISDVTEARKNLMSIQDELIAKFGTEGDAIASITEAINNQSDALDQLTEKKWQETKNKFNDGGFINDFANWSNGHKDNVDRMVSEMEHAREILSFSYNDFDSDKFDGLKQQMDGLGWTYQRTLGGFVKEGNLDGIYSDILEIQNMVKDVSAPDKFIKDLTKDANMIKSTLENYQDIWDTYILQDRIFENEQLADSWRNVNDAYAEYQDAFASGDETAIAESTALFAETLSSVLNDSNVDQSVKDYFRNMYPALAQEVSEWQFKTDFEPNIDGLKDKVETALSSLDGIPAEGLLDFSIDTATEGQVKAYQSLKAVARDYGIEIGQLINLLQEMGYVQSDSYMQLAKKFGKENIGKLSPEDLEIAYSIENVGELTFEELQQEIQRIKDTPVSLTFNISTYEDSISDIQSSISTLREALDSLNSGDLRKVEVIELMQQFPELVPYIDLTANGFGNLLAGLSELISQQPTAFIQELNELKESLATDEERAQVDLLIDSLQRLSSYGDTGIEAYATTIGSTWGDTANVIAGVTTQFENLAKVQEAVADGLTMSATAASELAKMYPEILTNAEFSANGQVTLNEGVVKSILDGDNSIINAQIAKLEADKAELTAKRSFAEAQLNIAKQVGEGEGQISKEVAQYRLDIANQLVEKLIEAGMEEDKAYAAVAENMAGNMDEYNRIVGEVAEDMSVNLDAAAVSMAESISINSINAQNSFENLRKKVGDLAEAIKNAAEGKQGGNAGIYGGGGSTSKGGITANKHSGQFNTTLSEYTAKTAKFDDFQSQLALDIKGYTDAISNIDSQIEVLKNLQKTFESNGGVGGHGYTDQIKKLEKEKEKLNDSAKDSSKASSDSNKETAESFNWIETAISRVQQVIKSLGNTVSATWKSWKDRNNSLTQQLNEVRKEISLQQSAYESYMQAAESVGLSDHYKNLVKNGSFSIEDIADDTLKEQIKSYQEWYNKALDCSDAIQDLNNQLAELAKTKFDNVSKKYDANIQDIDFVVSLINKELDKTAELNQIAGDSFYNALIEKEKERIDVLTSEYDELCRVFNESVSNGMVTAGSEAWQEMKSGIDSVAESIRDAEVEILKYQNSIKEIAKLKFDDLEKQFDNVAGAISSSLSKIEKEISLVEESGAIAGESFYQALINTSNVSLEALQQKHKSLSDSLKEALDNGSVQEYDDTWYEMKNAVDSVEGEILDTRLALIKYEESLKQVAVIKFDDLVNQFGNVSNAVSDTISIIEKQLAYVEESGKIAGKTFYEALINSQKDSISIYESELEALNKAFQEAIENESIIKGDSTWFEKKSEISAVEAALWDAQTALAQYENSLKEVATVRFDSLNSQFNNAISLIVSDMDLLEKQMSLIEASGKEAGESFYEELIGSGNTKIEALKKQYDELYEAMDGVEKYSDDWYDMVGTLNKIKGEIIDTEAAVKRYGNSLKEVSMLKFNNIGEQYDNALSLINAQIDEIEIKMQIAQESGYIAGSSFYSALISAETKNLEILEKEYSALVSALNEALANGSMQKYDANWYAAAQKISAVRKAYLNAQLSQVKYQNSMKSDISGDTGSTSTRDIAKEKFDSLVKQFDGAIGIITSAMDQLEKKMELVGEAGYVAGESFYNSLIEAEKVHIESLVKEYETLSASLNDVEKYSDNWYNMVGSINSVKDALIDAETALIKYGNALKELDWDMFDRAQDSIGNLSGESDFITELLGTNRETMNDDGTLNDRGLAIQGLHAVNYDVYMRQVQEYGDAIKKLNKEIAEDPGNTKLLDRYNELLELQREAAINAENEKTALKELASDGYDALLSRLDELIKARKDALKAASDLHDYEKTVSEQANEVNRLQKLMVNFAGDDSEEMKATIQKTQEALIKAQEELSETEYDRYIQDQESMLDSFSDSLKEWVNARLDDINGLLQNAINATNAGSQAIRDQINADLADVGMSMTDNFSKIFTLDYSGGLKDIVSGFYGGGFDNAVTAVNAAIDHVIAETNKVLVSTDMVGDILNQRFPELAASIPSLDETNGRIGNVNLAIIETRDAMDHVHARIAELDSNTSSGIGGVTQEIEGIDGSLDDIGLDLDDIGLDLEEFDKNTDESLGDINEALEGVTDKVSETGAIANKLDDINKTIEASKRPVEELKIPLNNITQEIVNVRAALSMINTTVANLHFELPGYGSGSSSGGSSSPSSSSNYSSSSSSSSGGNSNNNDVWKHKVDNYPKDKLNTGTSVVDAMKNQNIDSSYSSRKEYFEKLGGSGTYTGSAEQNKWLMSKLPGYKNGVRNLPNDEIAVTQEDGTELILSPYEGGIVTPLHKGDSVLTAEQSEKILKLSNMSGDELREHFFSVYMPKHDVNNMMPERNYVETNAPTQNDIDVSFNIPNVRDSDEMANFLKSDRAERIIRSIIDTYALGKNPYRKLRY